MTDRANRLEEAFGAFNRLSEELAEAYRDLEQRASRLAEELARSRREKERQRAEKERLADRLGVLIDSLPGGVIVLDDNGCIRESNAVARRWLGVSMDGRDFSAVLADAGCKPLDSEDAVEVGDRELSLSRQLVEGGRETIVLLTDVTEERRLRARLDRNRRLAAMGEMAARLAHQVRTPLSSALLYASHLGERELSSERRRRFGQRLIEHLRDLENMTGDMLGFVRGGIGPTENVSVAELIDDVRQSLAGATGERRLEVRNEAASDRVQVDRRALSGALCNLVENAWQAGDDRTRVVLSARRGRNGRLDLEVRDDGPGIDPALQERVFEPFFTRRPGGTGLGLAVARSVAQAHQGELLLESRPGAGTRFVLQLPRVPADRAVSRVPALISGGAA